MSLQKKLTVIGSIIVGVNVLLLFIALNPLVRFGVKDQTALKKGNDIRGIYLKIPFPLDFNVYFFNITNPDEVQNGKKPILQEIGPYCYDEFHEKHQVTDNEEDDTLTYRPYSIFKFNKEKSGRLSDTDNVTILNPLLMGMINTVLRDSPALLSIVSQAVDPLFRNPSSIYLTGRVRDILFDGIEVDCTGTEFAGKAVCSQLKISIPDIKEASTKNVYLISSLGSRNATLGKKVKVQRGIKSSRNLGQVMEVDGKPNIDLWSTEECNNFTGSDGWIIPPLLRAEDGISMYSTELCRNVHAFYIGDGTLKGLNVRRYEANLGDAEANEEDKCYCDEKVCPPKGTYDMKKCLGLPVIATLPHFLYADESFLNGVDGMRPSEENHSISLTLEPTTSTPLKAVKRMQLNFQVAPNDKVSIMNNLSTVMHPVFWIEEGIDLEGPILKKVQTIFLVLKVVEISRWIILLVGAGVLVYAGYIHLINKKSMKISHIHDPVKTISSSIEKKVKTLTNTNDATNNSNGRTFRNNVLTGHELSKFNKNV